MLHGLQKGVVLATLSYTGANTTAFGYTPSIGTLAGPFNVCVTGCVNGGYQVTASYPGASAETVSLTVATPLEQEINGVENMLYVSSQSTGDGNLTVTVTFQIGTDLQHALSSCAEDRHGLRQWVTVV